MRECQLCGTKSWGPLTARGRALLLNAVPPETREVDFIAYRECDNCAMPALTSIVERPAPDADFSDLPRMGFAEVIGMRPPGPDPMAQAIEVLKDALSTRSERETRLERIVLATIRAKPAGVLNARTAEYAALEVVLFARAIDAELSK